MSRERKPTVENMGNRLKKERLRQGLSFEEAHSSLKIHPNVLRELEEGEVSNSLSGIYIKGFIRKYAEYLGLDPDDLLGGYPGEKARDGAAEDSFLLGIKKDSGLPPLRKNSRFEDTVLPVFSLTAAVLALFLAVYAGFKFTGRMRGGTDREDAAAAMASSSEGGASARAVKEAPDAPEPAEEKPEKPPLLVPQGTPLRLTAVTSDKVWVSVTSDGRVIFQNTLAEGSQMQWQADDQLELWVGRGDALDLTLNDTHIGSPGVGRIRRVIFDRSGMTIKKK